MTKTGNWELWFAVLKANYSYSDWDSSPLIYLLPPSLANFISIPYTHSLRNKGLEVKRRALKLKATLLLVCSPGNMHGGRAAGRSEIPGLSTVFNDLSSEGLLSATGHTAAAPSTDLKAQTVAVQSFFPLALRRQVKFKSNYLTARYAKTFGNIMSTQDKEFQLVTKSLWMERMFNFKPEIKTISLLMQVLGLRPICTRYQLVKGHTQRVLEIPLKHHPNEWLATCLIKIFEKLKNPGPRVPPPIY